MPNVTVLYGPAYDGKNDETFEKCLQLIREHEAQSCVYLVRSDVRVRRLRDRILREFSGCFHFPVSTLPDFFKALYQRRPEHKALLGELEQKILIEDLLHAQLERRRGRSCFRAYREHPGIVTKVRDFLDDLRRVGFASAEELATSLHACRGRQPRIYQEVLDIFRSYTEHLETSAKIDESGIFLELAHAAQTGSLDIGLWTDSPELLVLEGYYELTRPVQQIFSALCAQFEQTFITVDVAENPYEYAEAADIPKSSRVYRHILPYIRESGFSVRRYTPDAFGSLQPQRRTDRDRIPARDARELFIHASADRREEVTRIAKTIRQLQQQGRIVHLHEIGVAFPQIEQYEHAIRDIFPRYGIPFSMFHGYSLASSPLVITIFRLFRVLLEDGRLDSVHALFSSPLVQWSPLPPHDSSREAHATLTLDAGSIHHLESLAQRLEIRQGRSVWIEKLLSAQAAPSSCEEKRDATPFSEPAFQNSTPGQDIEKTIQRSIIPLLLDFFNFLGRFELTRAYDIQDFLDFIREAIRRLQLPARILQSKERSIREQESCALATLLDVLNVFEQELQKYAAPQGRYSTCRPEEFSERLRTLLAEERYYVPQQLHDSVCILGRLDTRQLRFRHFFFGGLVERDFPGQEENHIFLSAQDVELLGLPTDHDRLEESAHLFHLNSLNPTEALYLSYPLQQDEKDLLRSSYIEQLIRQSDTTESVLLQHECNSADSAQTLYSSAELYAWLGRCWYDSQAQPGTAEDLKALIRELLPAERAERFLQALQAQSRQSSLQFSAFDGILAAKWTKAQLRRRYDPHKHVYSATEFDLYARCPIKFFFQYLLGLTPLMVFPTEMDALEKGMLLHKILFRFYAADPSAARSGNPTIGNVDRRFLHAQSDRARWQEEARIRMLHIAEEELEAYHFSGLFWEQFREDLLSGLSPKSLTGDSDNVGQQGLLAAFIDLESRNEDKVTPAYLEAHFGIRSLRSGGDHSSDEFGYRLSADPCELHGHTDKGRPATIRFQGKIDRIDLEDVSTANSRPKAVLYDYKTGKLPANSAVMEGRSFQLPLYVLAAREYLGDSAELVAGGYYALQNRNALEKKVFLGGTEHGSQKYFNNSRHKPSMLGSYTDVLKLLRYYADLAVQSAEKIRKGRFHPTFLKENDAGCHYCDYRRICRLDPRRMKRLRAKAHQFQEDGSG